MIINSNFDGGSIEVVSVAKPDDIQLKIRKDIKANNLQWFYFHFVGQKQQEYKIKIINANDAPIQRAGQTIKYWPLTIEKNGFGLQLIMKEKI